MEKRSIVFLSGAGISAESGISTFRSSGGLWEYYSINEVCTPEAFRKNRSFVLEFYNKRRAELQDKQPNPAHRMIAALEKEYGKRIINITQNIDDLFEKAGCSNVVHVHGELTKARCEVCGHIWNVGYNPIYGNERCPDCGNNKSRHHVVMFYEEAPLYRMLYATIDEMRKTESMLVVIGTSGQVLPVELFAQATPISILNNLEPEPAIDDSLFTHVFYEKAGSASAVIQKLCREHLES